MEVLMLKASHVPFLTVYQWVAKGLQKVSYLQPARFTRDLAYFVLDRVPMGRKKGFVLATRTVHQRSIRFMRVAMLQASHISSCKRVAKGFVPATRTVHHGVTDWDWGQGGWAGQLRRESRSEIVKLERSVITTRQTTRQTNSAISILMSIVRHFPWFTIMAA